MGGSVEGILSKGVYPSREGVHTQGPVTTVTRVTNWRVVKVIIVLGKIPTKKIKFFEKVILPLYKTSPNGVNTEQMEKKSKEIFEDPISKNTINYHYLRPLEKMDLITRGMDPDDRRRKLTKPLRDEVFTEKEEIYTLFEKGDIFALEDLKEAFNELKQLIVRDTHSNSIKIKDYDNTPINIEKLYEDYFAPDLIDNECSNNYLSEQEEKPKQKEKGENIPDSKKGTTEESGDGDGDGEEISNHRKKEQSKDGLNVKTESENLSQEKVDFRFKRIPPAEKCTYCGVRSVEYEILDVSSNRKLRKCMSFFRDMRNDYPTSRWKRGRR